MTKEEAYKSYKNYEAYVSSEVKSGLLSREKAARYLKEAKHNYSNMNYERQLERIRRK